MRTIFYPIFLSCRDYTADIFWKKTFENLAYNETPRGIYIKDNTLYSITKKKEFNYVFAGKDALDIYSNVYSLLGTLYGLKSKGDLSKKREIFEEFQKANSSKRTEDLWSKIKRKSLRDNLIQDYVIDSKKLYNLDENDTKKLYFFISVGCIFKLFSGNDITLQNGYISSVEGVNLSDRSVVISRQFDEPILKKETGKVIYLYALWSNYLKTLN